MRQAIAVQHILISIHALREEGDQVQGALDREPEKFLSTPSARRATLRSVRQDVRNDISIHALREEGDHGSLQHDHDEPISIHALREEGDEVCLLGVAVGRDFYPRPPRGGRREDVRVSRQSRGISIHALREEGDYTESRGRSGAAYFYPRPPRGGRPLCASALA